MCQDENFVIVNNVPENCRMSSKAILDFMDVIEQDSKTFLLISDNKIITQFSKKPYSFCDQQLLFSMTKSITSLGIGIASDKAYIDLDDKVISYFPDKLPKQVCKNLRNMSIKHLLTMTSGIHDNTIGLNNYFRLDGAFGQICLVIPDKKVVIVETSRKTKTEKLLEYIYGYLLNSYNTDQEFDQNIYDQLRIECDSCI